LLFRPFCKVPLFNVETWAIYLGIPAFFCFIPLSAACFVSSNLKAGFTMPFTALQGNVTLIFHSYSHVPCPPCQLDWQRESKNSVWVLVVCRQLLSCGSISLISCVASCSI